MTILFPMSPSVFKKFAAEANQAYAEDQINAGVWAPHEALAKANALFNQLLPDGMDTQDHYFYEVRDRDDHNCSVGYLWFAVNGADQARAGYIYNIRIHPNQQRKGHGKAAFLALEKIAAKMQLPAIRLNVFAHNPAAQALYRSLGYQVSSSIMCKPLNLNLESIGKQHSFFGTDKIIPVPIHQPLQTTSSIP